jgi:hypothetical protein
MEGKKLKTVIRAQLSVISKGIGFADGNLKDFSATSCYAGLRSQ